MRVCAHRHCQNPVISDNTKQIYCCPECRGHENRLKLNERRLTESALNKQNINNKIDEKYLVRGKISKQPFGFGTYK